jgi:hypothetical protein
VVPAQRRPAADQLGESMRLDALDQLSLDSAHSTLQGKKIKDINKSRFLYSLNPLVGLIDGFRAALFNLPLPWTSMIISAVVTWPLLILAIHVFRKMEVSFADDV